MKIDVTLVFPTYETARLFVVSEKIICYGIRHEKNVLRCLCTKEQAETAICNYNAILVDVHPVLSKSFFSDATNCDCDSLAL